MHWKGFVEYMDKNRLTSKEVAEKLNVSKATIMRWRSENGSCPAIKLAEYFPKLKELAEIKKPTLNSLLVWGELEKNKSA